MKLKKIKCLLFVLAGWLFLIFYIEAKPASSLSIPEAVYGKIDLRNIDFSAKTSISLKGMWEFYWDELLLPEEVSKISAGPGYLEFPGAWNKPLKQSRKYPVFGAATLRLKILHTETTETLALYLGDVSSACKIYVNNALIISKGKVSRDKNQFLPDYAPEIAFFKDTGTEWVLTIQVSNFADRLAGIKDIRIGTAANISGMRNLKTGQDLFLVGCFLIIGLYYLNHFLLRKKEKSTLYFCLFCMLIALRTALMGERCLYQLFPAVPFTVFMQIEFLTIPLAVIVFINYFRKLYFHKWFKYVNIFTIIISSVYCLFILVTPLILYAQILLIYLIFACVFCSALIWGLITGIRKKKEGAVTFLAGFLFLFAAAANDALYYLRLVNTGYLLPWGFLILIFFQSFILSWRFTNAFKSIEKLLKRLMAMDKLKDAFLINTSHELRTPLHGIIGLTENLRTGSAGKINTRQARILSLIEISAKRLVNLVNDILDFSRIKQNQLLIEKHAVDLREICDVVFLFSRLLVGNKHLELINAIPEDFPLVEGDINRIQQIMHNLIGNAVKFTNEGLVEVSALVQDNTARIAVRDTGIGIPEDKIGSLFESFERLDRPADKLFGGTGLGLSITKQLIEAHGGSIEVTSAPGYGSTFLFSLPLSREKEKHKASEDISTGLLEFAYLEPVEPQPIEVSPENSAPAAPDINKEIIRVLAVDDEIAYLTVIRENLASEEYQVTTAANGTHALELVEKEAFDIILLDIMMPVMSGCLVCREIRKRYPDHELPVIMLTAKNFVSDLVESLQSGANDYLSKPVSKAELTARINLHVHHKKINRAYNRFVPEQFLKLLGKESFIDVRPGDHVLRNMTILFCNIRSFMSLSGKLSPRQNFEFLNSYFEKMSPVITKNNGFIDKYIGDKILALFPESPEHALKAALEMKHAADVYNSFRIKTGYDPITIGIGLHSGAMILGTIGNEHRMESTVISDAVNVASGLEGLTKLYGGNIIISSSIFYSLKNPGDYLYRFLGLVQVKGKQEAVHIYEFFDDTGDGIGKKLTKDTFEKSLQRYYNKEFAQAEPGFTDILKLNPADKAARLYLARCREYMTGNVPEDWDGVETMDNK